MIPMIDKLPSLSKSKDILKHTFGFTWPTMAEADDGTLTGMESS